MSAVPLEMLATVLGRSKSQISRRAHDEGWAFTEVPVRGGQRRLYDISALPREVQDALARRQLEQVQVALREKGVLKDAPAAPSPAALVLTPPEKISTGKKAEARRENRQRLSIGCPGRRPERHISLVKLQPPIAAHWTLAASAVLAGASLAGLPLPEVISKQPKWVFEAQRSCSPATIKRIAATVRAGALKDLAGRYGGRKDTGVLDRAFDGDVAAAILVMIAKGHVSAGAIRQQIIGNFGREAMLPGGEIAAWPSLRRFQDWIAQARVEHASTLLAISNPDAWRNKHEFAFGRQETGDALNDIWQIDASPADVMTLTGRYTVYVLICLFSRRLMVLVTKTPRAEAVVALLRRAMLAWGVPKTVKTDNGSDFKAVRVRSVLAHLGVEHELSPPYTPTDKGHVERAIGTLQRGFMARQPGFVGHSVADAQAIRSRKAFAARLGEDDRDAFRVELSAEELQRRVDAWAALEYGQAPHGGLDGRSPAQVAMTAAGSIRTVDERALDMLLMDLPSNEGLRRVRKKGLQVERAYFISPALVGLEGRQVKVRLDPTDMGRIYVYTADGDQFVCVAENPERAGISRAAVAIQAKQDQARATAETKRDLSRIRRKLRPFHEVADQMAREALPPVIEFPRAAESYTTPALAAAADAAGVDMPLPAAPAPAGQRPPAQIIALSKPVSALDDEAEKKARRIARWKGLDARLKAGEVLEPADERWHRAYGRDAELITALKIEQWQADGLLAGGRPA